MAFKHLILPVVSIGIAGGIYQRSFFDLGNYFILFLILLSFACIVYGLLAKGAHNSKLHYIFLAALFIASSALGIIRYDLSDNNLSVKFLQDKIGSEVLLYGFVSEEADIRETHTKYTVNITKYFDGFESTETLNTRALIIAEHYPKLKYGDRVEINGEIAVAGVIRGEDDRIFDYKAYLAKDGIQYQLFFPEIVKVGDGHGNPIKSILIKTKQAFMDSVSNHIVDPEASLLGGLLVGSKRSLGEDLLEAFRRTGIIHIVVLSGYNVTLIAESIMRVFGFLPRFAGLYAGGTSIILFAIMTGASATVVRASAMALLVLLARGLGRNYVITNALLAAGLVMLLFNPKILVFDPSFQLSFLATVGLIYVVPILEPYFKWITPEQGPSLLKTFKDIVLATFATQIFVLPHLLWMMGNLSIVSVPVNLLILPFVPATMLFGFLTGVLGWISGVLAFIPSIITYAFLAYMLKVVAIFNALPFAAFHVPAFGYGVVALVYGVMGVWLWRYR